MVCSINTVGVSSFDLQASCTRHTHTHSLTPTVTVTIVNLSVLTWSRHDSHMCPTSGTRSTIAIGEVCRTRVPLLTPSLLWPCLGSSLLSDEFEMHRNRTTFVTKANEQVCIVHQSCTVSYVTLPSSICAVANYYSLNTALCLCMNNLIHLRICSYTSFHPKNTMNGFNTVHSAQYKHYSV